jgi:peroxiredoxin
MANQYTGDFDVVAEFALPGVNRVLAAMHQTGRLLHVLSGSVDDNPPPGTHPVGPVLGGVVDAFGNAVVNQKRIGKPNLFPGAAAVTDPILSRLDPVVNLGAVGIALPPIVPSHLSGRVQMQLFPATLDVPDATGLNLALTMNVMARYFPDPNTAPLAEFVRGDLHITAPVNQIQSKAGGVVEIDFTANEAVINFTPSYASTALSADDVAGINLLIRNALATSFLPSSATLPSGIAQVEFKSLLGPPKAIAVMLNMSVHAAASASVNNAFLGPADDFAYAASREFILASVQPVIDNLLSQPFPPAKFAVNLGFTTLHFTYPITLTGASFDLQPLKIVLTVNGHAGQSNHSWAGPFDFTVTMDFSLAPDQFTVSLVNGPISVNTGSLLAELVDFFSGAVTSAIASARDAAISSSGAITTMQNMFDTRRILGNFLNSLLTPVSGPPLSSQNIELLYSAVNIQPAGIVLSGVLILAGWPAPHAEYQPIPPNPSSGGPRGVGLGPISQGTDYSAFLSWIPGGAVSQYEWSIQGIEQNHPFEIDPNKFVLLHSGPVISAAIASGSASASSVAGTQVNPPAYSTICLTVRGTRISAAGPAVYQQVAGSVCGYTRFPVVANGLAPIVGNAGLVLPVTQPGASGEVQVTGHTSAQVARNLQESPNVLLHVADATSATQLELLTKAVAQSQRTDATTAVLAVVPPTQLATIRYTQRVIYVEDPDGSWGKVFGVPSGMRPFTSIIDRQGKTVWKQAGPLDQDALAGALAKNLMAGGAVRLSVPRANTRIGQLAPDFYFQSERGRWQVLRKLSGRSLNLIFWKSSSQPSINAVLAAQKSAASAGTPPLVLAINDGEPSDQARAAAAENGFTAILVTDPKREISTAYGITLVPTTLRVDDTGTITAIQYGYAPGSRIQPLAAG